MADECDHDKVHGGVVLGSYPARYPWVCRRCFEVGVDTAPMERRVEYVSLMQLRQGSNVIGVFSNVKEFHSGG